jgi:hypothetical protein
MSFHILLTSVFNFILLKNWCLKPNPKQNGTAIYFHKKTNKQDIRKWRISWLKGFKFCKGMKNKYLYFLLKALTLCIALFI